MKNDARVTPVPGSGNFLTSFINTVLGRPLASNEQCDQQIGVFAGLPALGLDGLSSSAYGPEAALTILVPLGFLGTQYILPITLTILALLALLYFSYRQTIEAYPLNGGSYTVAKENLGTWARLFSAAALMIDYILTVAVGISAGVAALVSAAPTLHHQTLPLCLAVLVLITLANLRGTGEAGLVFALPTYTFLACMAVVLGIGITRSILAGRHPHAVTAPPPFHPAVEGVGVWLLLRSFASGCTAMTGVEAVSNGVGAFKEPTVKNAHRTLTWIVGILAILLAGVAYLARAYGIGAMDQEHDRHYQSVLSLMTGAVVGRGWFYTVTMSSVLAVLCLSANTSFVGFPRLCRLIAKDDFLPQSFAAIGRRLVYSVGVLFLAAAAALLLVVFRGIADKLIPLYAVGAFLAFTLSQSGMVVHWFRQRRDSKNKQSGSGLALRMAVNGIGAVATAAALVIILAAKFTEGAWITILAIPALLALFKLIHRHYGLVNKQLALSGGLDTSPQVDPIVVVPLREWDKPTAKAIRVAMHLSDDVIAVHLSNLEGDEAKNEAARVQREWSEKVESPARDAGWALPRLEFVQTPYREFVTPCLQTIEKLKKEHGNRPMIVIIPEIAVHHWWQAVLHSNRSARLRTALRRHESAHVVVIEVPWFLEK